MEGADRVLVRIGAVPSGPLLALLITTGGDQSVSVQAESKHGAVERARTDLGDTSTGKLDTGILFCSHAGGRGATLSLGASSAIGTGTGAAEMRLAVVSETGMVSHGADEQETGSPSTGETTAGTSSTVDELCCGGCSPPKSTLTDWVHSSSNVLVRPRLLRSLEVTRTWSPAWPGGR